MKIKILSTLILFMTTFSNSIAYWYETDLGKLELLFDLPEIVIGLSDEIDNLYDNTFNDTSALKENVSTSVKVKEEVESEESTRSKDIVKEAGYAHYAGNYKLALKLYEPEALKGSPEAQYMLGTMYHYGEGVNVDYNLAFKWYKESADKDYSDSFYEMALLYQEGKGVLASQENALYWYRKAHNSNDLRAKKKISELLSSPKISESSNNSVQNITSKNAELNTQDDTQQAIQYIEKLFTLKHSGAITDKEFDFLKSRLLE